MGKTGGGLEVVIWSSDVGLWFFILMFYLLFYFFYVDKRVCIKVKNVPSLQNTWFHICVCVYILVLK